MTGPGPNGVQVSPEDLARAARAADICGADLDAVRRHFSLDATARPDAAPEPTTGQLLAEAARWYGGTLDRYAAGMTDIADGLRGDSASFRELDDAGAGRIASALEPGRPPR